MHAHTQAVSRLSREVPTTQVGSARRCDIPAHVRRTSNTPINLRSCPTGAACSPTSPGSPNQVSRFHQRPIFRRLRRVPCSFIGLGTLWRPAPHTCRRPWVCVGSQIRVVILDRVKQGCRERGLEVRGRSPDCQAKLGVEPPPLPGIGCKRCAVSPVTTCPCVS